MKTKPTPGTQSPPVVLIIINKDDDGVRDCVPALRQAGYEVLTARDSLEAQYVCEFYPRLIGLVLLDLPLERLTCIEGLRSWQYGTKLIAMVRVMRPSSHILLTSPTPAWKVSRQRLGATLWQFPLLQRPCPTSELLDTIKALLTTDPTSPPASSMTMNQCA